MPFVAKFETFFITRSKKMLNVKGIWDLTALCYEISGFYKKFKNMSGIFGPSGDIHVYLSRFVIKWHL